MASPPKPCCKSKRVLSLASPLSTNVRAAASPSVTATKRLDVPAPKLFPYPERPRGLLEFAVIASRPSVEPCTPGHALPSR